MNKTMLMGRLAKDPELRVTTGGSSVCNFTLAVNRNFKNSNGEREVDFITCTSWGRTGEFIAEHFGKGQMMLAEGRIQVRSYEAQDGQKRWVTDVVVEQVEFTGPAPKNENREVVEDLGEVIAFDDNELPF